MRPNHAYWSGKRACVTGGTGLLGFQVVRQLHEAGARVRVLALPAETSHPIHGLRDVACVFGDVRDEAVVREAVGDSEVIFHTAGVVAVWGPMLGQLASINVEGTRRVLEVAGRGARVVHTSSVVAVGASAGVEPLDERSAFDLHGLKIDYVHAKVASERVAMDAASRGQDVVVTNPGYLVGPEDYQRSVMGRFCKRFWKGRIPVAPPGGFNLVDVRDAATGHLLAAECGRSGRRYILGGENRTFPEFLALLAEAGGMDPRGTLRLPRWGLSALARLGDAHARLSGKEPYPSVQHARLNHYHWFYRSDRAAVELGFAPRPLSASLSDAYEWHHSRSKLGVDPLNRWWLRPGSMAPDRRRCAVDGRTRGAA